MEHLLASLRDIEGVSGAFLLDHRGHLVATSVPGFVGHEELRNAGPRIAGIMDAFAELSGATELAHLRFQNHHLYITPCGDAWLVALGHTGLNLRGLKLGLRLVVRRVVKALEDAAPVSASPESKAETEPRAVEVAPADQTPIPHTLRAPEPVPGSEPEPHIATLPPPAPVDNVAVVASTRAIAGKGRTIVYRGRKYVVAE